MARRNLDIMDGSTDPYRLTRMIGSGGMGIVHEAWDTRLERRVAIKMLHSHLVAIPALAERFKREAQKAARIEHPNVVRIYRTDFHEGRFVIEMQYVDGTPLSELLQSGPLPPGAATNVLRQVLEALIACHEQGVIHCDLKPGNLLVTRDGQVMLTDFGIARALSEGTGAESSSATWSGPVWGTPVYTAPEAWDGKAVTPQWDLYAAGALIYEAISGTAPFEGGTPLALMKAVATSSPEPVKSRCPEMSDAFAALITSLMARDPALRPVSARAALELLNKTPERMLEGVVTAPLAGAPPAETESTSRETPGRMARRNRLITGVGLGTVLILIGVGLSVTLYPNRRGADSTSAVAPTELHETAARTPVESGNAVPVKHDPHAAELLVVNGDAYFSADDGVHGRELWCKLHDSPTPLLVADIVPGPGSSNPRYLTMRPAGDFVFAASTPETGEELWYCGTPTRVNELPSVRLIKDILPGPMGSLPVPAAAEGGLVLFYATTLTAGRELWCTNGHADQTAMVEDLNPGQASSQPMTQRVVPVNGGAFVVAFTVAHGIGLHRYDYATNSLHEIGNVGSDTGYMALLGHRLLFANSDPEHGYELWVYDEDTGEFGLLADLWPGPEGSGPDHFFVFGEQALFHARTSENGSELWSSDGTAKGTYMLADINPGPHDSDPYGFVSANQRVFFRAKDDACGRELWVTDGTKAGTTRVADIKPGPDGSEPYNLVAYRDSVFFTADDGVHGEELWYATYIEGQWKAYLVFDLYPGPTGSEPHQLQWAGKSHGFFLAKTPNAGETLCYLSVSMDSPQLVQPRVVIIGAPTK